MNPNELGKSSITRKILIIDDDQYIRTSVSAYLEDCGFQTLIAEGGAQGLEKFRSETLDVVMVDLVMPHISGHDVIRSIHEENPDLPLLVVSGTGVLSDAVEAMRLGAWDFILKPIVDFHVLSHAIEKALERAELIQMNQRHQQNLEAEVKRRTKALAGANLELQEINTRLKMMVKSTRRISAVQSIQDTMFRIMEEYARNLIASGGSIYTRKENKLILFATLDSPHAALELNLPVDPSSVMGWCIKKKTAVSSEEMKQNPGIELNLWEGYLNRSFWSGPVFDPAGDLMAVINIHNKYDPYFTQHDSEIANLLLSFATEVLHTAMITEKLRISEQNYRRIFSQIQDVYFEISMTGTILEVSPSVYPILGYSRNDLIGQKVQNYIVDTNRWQDLMEELKQTSSVSDFEGLMVHVDRTFRHCSINARQESGQPGRPGWIAGSLRDITNRKKIEEDLLRERNFNMELIQSSPLYFIAVSPAGTILLMNETMLKVMEYTEPEIVDKNFISMFIEPDDQLLMIKSFELLMQVDEPVMTESRVQSKSGSQYIVEWYGRQKYKEGKEIDFIFCVGVDITKRRRTEEQLALHQQQLIEADKMNAMGTIVTGVSHEINNPNNLIMLSVPLLQEYWEEALPVLEDYVVDHPGFQLIDESFSEAQTKYPALCRRVMDSSVRIGNIIMDLERYTRKTIDEVEESIQINNIVESAIIFLHNLIKDATAHFSVDLSEDIPEILVRQPNLKQVIINLIQNACQALPDTSRKLRVSTRYHRKRRQIIITVKDEGIGIPAENLPLILNPFFTTKRDYGGTGLGLAISNRIVHDIGGTIDFKSEVGKGTVARIIIPVVEERNEQTENEPN